ncbi:MAG: helix-turn-helix domain-containing protein [Actinomycetota bacterium]|nr:helix-turn-helix domain-containing protein [Actinomycetota bacterium]
MPAAVNVGESSPEPYADERWLLGLGIFALTLVVVVLMTHRPLINNPKATSVPASTGLMDPQGSNSLGAEDQPNGHGSNGLAMVQKKAAVAHPETLPTSLRALEAEVRRSGKTASSAILFPVVEEEYYTPPQAARVLKLSRQRITQMLQSGEMEGTQDPESGRWRIPQSVVHARLKDRPARRRSNDEGSQSAPEGSQRLRELEVEVRDLSYRLGRSEALLELTESTLHAERDRFLEELKRERERADRLERELEEARRQGRRRLFGN